MGKFMRLFDIFMLIKFAVSVKVIKETDVKTFLTALGNRYCTKI